MNVCTEVAGSIWKIEKSVGDRVEEGDVIMIIESMKMEIPVEAESAGVIAECLVAPGDVVAEGDLLVTLRSV